MGPLRLFHQITVTQEAVQESAHLCNEWQTEIVCSVCSAQAVWLMHMCCANAVHGPKSADELTASRGVYGSLVVSRYPTVFKLGCLLHLYVKDTIRL